MARTKLKLKSIATGTLPGAIKVASENLGTGVAAANLDNDSITPDHISHTVGHWEVIDTIANGAGYVGESDGQIKFQSVFSTKYMVYWLHIGHMGFGNRSGYATNADIYLRYMSGSSDQNSTAYNGHIHRQLSGNSNYSSVTITNANTGTIFEGQWDQNSGGMHGDIYFYNMHAPVFNTGGSIDKGSYYRPYYKSELMGYNNSENHYSGQTVHIRYNQDGADDAVDGFKIFNSSNASAHPGTFMTLYGMKHNPANTTSP